MMVFRGVLNYLTTNPPKTGCPFCCCQSTACLIDFCFLFFSQVPVIKKTWEKDALFLEYYSDHADPSIPTIDIGVPNTERGEQPLRFFFSHFSSIFT